MMFFTRGAMKVRSSLFADEVALGQRPGITSWSKFGYRTSTTAAAGDETIWASTGNFTVMTAAETFTIAYTNSTDGLGTTGALSLIIDYIDENFELQQAVHVLGSSGSEVTSFTGLGINRVVVFDSGTANANTNEITLTATSAGTLQAEMPALGSVTQQAIFHVPINQTGLAKWLRISCNKLSGSSPVVTFKGFVYNRFTDTTYEIFREILDTASTSILDIKDPANFVLSGRDVLYFTMDTSNNNTIASCRFSLLLYSDN